MIKSKTLKFIIIIILFIYIVSYIISNSGYYEYRIQEKTILTNEKIKEFEDDVKNNRDVDVKKYLVTEDVDYSNKLTNIVYNISNKSSELTRTCIKKIFKKLSYLVEE